MVRRRHHLAHERPAPPASIMARSNGPKRLPNVGKTVEEAGLCSAVCWRRGDHGSGNDPKVVGLVYIAAFAPSEGESVDALIRNPPPGAPVPPILAPRDGRLFLDREKFHASFAADVDAEEAEFMADSQVPWGVDALRGTISKAAWRAKPSWYLCSTEDRMIPPAAQRLMAQRAGATTVEERGSHAIYVSRPQAVAALITDAARGVQTAEESRGREPESGHTR